MILIYATFPDLETAKSICRTLLDERLIACANLQPGMFAMYRWEGQTHEGSECAALLKTTSARLTELSARFHHLHPFDLPAWVQLDTKSLSPAYSAWVKEETQGEDRS